MDQRPEETSAPDNAASHADASAASWPARWSRLVAVNPGRYVAAILAFAAICGVVGAGLGVRSNLEDLFPEHTPAVVAAREAREILPSSNQMVVVFGSPDRAANRALATAFCAQAETLPEIASVECRREIDFFRKNAVLWMDEAELLKIDARVQRAVTEASARELVDPSLTAGLGSDASATSAAIVVGDVGDDPDSDFADEASDRPPAPAPSALAVAPAGNAVKAGKPGKDGEKAGKAGKDGKAGESSLHLPSEEEVLARLGDKADMREWAESPDGTVLGIKLYPRVRASDVEAAAALTAKVRAMLDALQPTARHPQMQVAIRGDYAEMSAEVDAIRHGLAITTVLALLGIALIQLFAFRSLRALLLLLIPLGVGIAMTVAFARVAIGYVNLITAFIFGILFGLGNDFGVYALTRYREARGRGKAPADALAEAMPTLWSALRTAALTTAASFLALVLFEFRGFSQFGLIAGVGVMCALIATMVTFPPLVLLLHRIKPETDVKPERTGGLRWMGALTRPALARVTIGALVVAAVVGALSARDLDFDTNFRKLRTPSRKVAADAKPGAEPDADEAETADGVAARRAREAKLGNRFGREASNSNQTPILVVTDSIDDARAVHDQLKLRSELLTRLDHFVSIHTFLPRNQERKAAIAKQIRQRIEAKYTLLDDNDKAEADRALTLLQPTPFGPSDLPDFVGKRFLDVEGTIGRYVLIYANGNLADARSVAEVIDQMGHFEVGPRSYRATASFFMLAEADSVVRREGPLAVLLAALAVMLVTYWHYRAVRPMLMAFVPLVLAFCIFLGAAQLLGLELNLFSITVLPSIFGIGVDGTVHLVHRCWGWRDRAELRAGVQQIGGAAWVAALTTVVGFGALAFQDNPGVQSLGAMAFWGILIVTVLANAITAAWLALTPGTR